MVKKYTFKIHYFASKYSKADNENDIINIPPIENNVDLLRARPGFDPYELYRKSGFLMIQKILYDYVLKQELNDNNAQINYKIIPQKYEEKIYNALNNYLVQIVSIFVLIAYALPLSINIYRLIQEKESRVKEIMKIMGLNEFNYFFSYFIIYFF